MARAHLTTRCLLQRYALPVLLATVAVPAMPASSSPVVDGTWSQPSLSASPSRRLASSLLYDGTRGRVILFGGFDFNETWVLDLENPTAWELLPVKGPALIARGDCNAVYDPVNDRLWIWGGHHSSGATYGEPAYLQFTDIPGDTATWVPFNVEREPGTSEQPTARFGSGTVYDPAGQRMIFYGGGYGTGGLMTGGTWAMSLDALPTWDLLPPTSPYSHGGEYSNLFIDTVRNRLVLHFTLASSNWWQFPYYVSPNIYTAPLDWSQGWTLLPQAGGDSLQYMPMESAYHPVQDRIVAMKDTDLSTYFGGPDLLGTWDFRFETGSWRHLYPENGPGPPSADDMVYDPEHDRMVVIRSPSASGSPMETWFLSWSGISGVDEAPASPMRLAAGAPRPNPSSAGVVIPLELHETMVVKALVIDAQGRKVRDLGSWSRAAGASELTWDGRNDRGAAAPAGVYFVRIVAGDGKGSTVVRVTRAR